jgi:hypothetical protein
MEDKFLEKFLKKYNLPEGTTSNSELIAELYDYDPSPNKKYLHWLYERFVGEFGLRNVKNFDHEYWGKVGDALVVLENYPQRFKNAELSTDIYSYNDLDSFLIASEKAFQRSNRKLVLKNDIDLVDEFDGIVILYPSTAEASCYYGKGTKWCVTDSSTYEDYMEKGNLFFILNKGSNSDDYKTAIYVDVLGKVEGFDATDNSLSVSFGDVDKIEYDEYAGSIVYPKRVILSNFTHGSITLKKDGTEKTFVMPEGIYVKRARSSVPGVCNFISGDVNAYFVRTINSYKKKLEKMPFENVDREFKIFLDVFKKYDKEDTLESLKPMLQKRATITAEEIGVETEEEKADYLTEVKKYVDTYDSFFKISTYLPGDIVVDKLFTRTNEEVVNTPSAKAWVCVLVNLPGSPDLFTLMVPQTRRGTINIYLSQVINFLKKKGVEEIIIFDNSCSVFMDKDDEQPSDRDIRHRRRTIAYVPASSTGKFGGKTKKRSRQKRRKTKNKKGKTSKRF